MQLKDNKSIRKAVVLIAVVALTGAIGVVLSAQMGPKRGMAQGPGMMAGPGGQRGGRGMMNPDGPMGGHPGRMGGPRGGPFGMIGLELRALDLTDTQREKIRAIVDSHRDELQATGTRMMEARQALRDAMAPETADEATIRQKAAAVGTAEGDIAVLGLKVRHEVFSVLTPEQREKANTLRTDRQNRMKNGRERIRRQVDERPGQERGGPQAV